MFRKVLIANRGEIALRILRACRTLGAEAVVAYSEADRDSLPVQLADEAICIGPSDARRSYLSAPAVISAALVTGCDAIHPGYGFLSEDEGFADVVAAHGLTFIGPSAAVLERFASKAGTRQLLAAHGLPTIPGSDGMLRDEMHALERGGADRLPGPHQAVGRWRRQGHAHGPHRARARVGPAGLPLRGQGRVRRRLALPREVARREPPRRGPGRDRPLRPRRPPGRARLLRPAPPPEDPRGGARRRPSRTRPGTDLAERAVRAAVAAGYENVGTLEFLVDAGGDFFFIEINCRIQVEHPVTEMLTGLDLVTTQIRIAAGEPLGFSQADVTMRGHAIEFRINAEDPEHEFRPGAGLVERYHAPGGPGVRMDSHLYSGYEVPPFYDSLLGKLIVWGPDRATAIARGRVALDELVVDGLVTNVSIHKALLVERGVPRGPDDDEPARPRRQRGLPRRGGAIVSRAASCRPAQTAPHASVATTPH